MVEIKNAQVLIDIAGELFSQTIDASANNNIGLRVDLMMTLSSVLSGIEKLRAGELAFLSGFDLERVEKYTTFSREPNPTDTQEDTSPDESEESPIQENPEGSPESQSGQEVEPGGEQKEKQDE